MKEAGLKESGSLEIVGDFRYQGGETAMEELLKLKNPPKTVFACNDMMALGAMRVINNHGLLVPDDISLVGFDGIPLSEFVYPSITTIAQPIKEMADKVVDYLVERIKNKENRGLKESPEFRKTILKTELIKRGSCGPPKGRFV